MRYDIKYLEDYKEQSHGPIQSDEALQLFSLVKVIRPKIIVEFGFLEGHSSRNFIKAMSNDCKLYSYDIKDIAKEASKSINDKRFKFIFKNQQDFEKQDIDNNLIDLLFMDAGHKFDISVKTFEKVKGSLNNNSIVVIHDTGSWNTDFLDSSYCKNGGLKETKSRYYIDEKEFVHRAEERKFVNYLKDKFPEFNQIHLHSLNTLRHGMTLLQKNEKLKNEKIGRRI